MKTLPLEVTEAAARGWRIHPVRARSKAAILKDWQHKATSDLGQIRAWARQFPGCNWGAVAGPESGFFAVDVDDPAAMQKLEDEYGPIPKGPRVVTARAYAILCEWPDGAEVRPATKHPSKGIDIRGRDSYIVIPPSIHPSGHVYHYSDDSLPIPACPDWLLGLILNREQTSAMGPQSAPVGDAVASQQIGKGGRTNRLVSLAGSMHKRGMTPDAIEAALLKENAQFAPPLPEQKVKAIAHDIPTRYPNPADEGRAGGFRLERLGDLLSKPDVPPDYLVDGLLVRGTVSAIVAKPKVGKSTLARLLCLAVATGNEFLDRSTVQGACIYLALEERQEEITADFRAMGADGTEAIDIHADTAPAGAIFALVDLVRNQRPALVVIDPLFRLAHIRDEKAYAEVYAALGPLIDAARETGTHILVTHHSGKAQKGDAIDAPLGSTALGGAVSTLIVLKRSDSYRSIQTVQRTGEDMPETVLSFNSATHQLSIGGTRAEADRHAIECEIVEYLKGAGERGEPEIVSHVEGANATKRKALRSLVERGQIERAGTGKKGNPFKYSFACTEPISRTSVQESENHAQTRMNTGEMLVRENPKTDAAKMLVRGFLDSECGGVLQ
jgi:hypothetical protein